jgi:hypothetical protein
MSVRERVPEMAVLEVPVMFPIAIGPMPVTAIRDSAVTSAWTAAAASSDAALKLARNARLGVGFFIELPHPKKVTGQI